MQLIHGGSLVRYLLPLLAAFALAAGVVGSPAGGGDHELHAVKLEAPAYTPKGVEHDKSVVPPTVTLLAPRVFRAPPETPAASTAAFASRTPYSIRAPPASA